MGSGTGLVDARRSGAKRVAAARAPGEPRRASAGRAGLLLVLLLVGVALGLVAWYAARDPGAASGGSPVAQERPLPATGAAAGAGGLPDAPGAPAGVPAERASEAPSTPRELTARDFRGLGSVRGTILLSQGAVLPEAWAVVVSPSRSLQGREHAETRRVEHRAPEKDFEVRDLPLGGYDVAIEGPGLAGNPVPVLLVRGSEHPFVHVAVHPRGLLDGSVLTESGRPAEDVLVVLELQPSGERFTTYTGPNGAFLFEGLPDGEYRLFVGGVTKPLVEPRELSFRAPSLRVPVQRVPELASLIVNTVDSEGNPVPSVVVQGFSQSGGQIDTVSSEAGVARIPSLRPGTYRLSLRDEATGRRGRSTIELEGGDEEEVWLAVRGDS